MNRLDIPSLGCTIAHLYLLHPPAMFSRPFHPNRFLRSVYGTEPFIAYCRERRIAFEQSPTLPLQKEDARAGPRRSPNCPVSAARVELELATVNEMAGGDAIAHLLEAAEGKDLPPDAVPSGAPVALWFFLHHPALFREVFLHHEIEEVDSWRTAQAAVGLDVSDLSARTTGLAEGLVIFPPARGERFVLHREAHRLQTSCCFIGQVADRLQFLDAFTDRGQATTQRVRPAQMVFFVYYPEDGTVLLKSPLRSRADDQALRSLRHGGPRVRRPLRRRCFPPGAPQGAVPPAPGREDMEMVRVKALHLRYPPARACGSSSWRRSPVTSRRHRPPAPLAHRARRPRPAPVAHAELQVRLRTEGQSKSYAIRLWPNRCNISQTPLGDRFRSCLKRWGPLPCGTAVNSSSASSIKRIPPTSRRKTGTAARAGSAPLAGPGLRGSGARPESDPQLSALRRGRALPLRGPAAVNCRSTVDSRDLHLWRLNLDAFLHWIVGQWKLRGGVRRIDGQLWQLGTLHTPGTVHECFYHRAGGFSEAARSRIAAYRRQRPVRVCLPERDDAVHRPHLSLLELLHAGEVLSLADPSPLLRPRERSV